MSIMSGILILTLVGMLGFLAVNIFVSIPAFHYGIKQSFGKRVPGPLYEGLRMKLPWERVVLISMAPEPSNFGVDFTTTNKVKLHVDVSLQWRPDPTVVKANRTDTYIEMSTAVVSDALQKRVSSLLGILGGQCDDEAFITKREELHALVNGELRFAHPRHENIKPAGWLDYYSDPAERLRVVDMNDRVPLEERSETVRRFGIFVLALEISEVKFSEETAEAQEEERQAGIRQKFVDKVVETAKKMQSELGISPDQAANMAAQLLGGQDTAPRTVFAAEGVSGIINAVVSKLSEGTRR
jgi:hypothetical protein